MPGRFEKTTRINPGQFDMEMFLNKFEGSLDEGGGQSGNIVRVSDAPIAGAIDPVTATEGWKYGQREEIATDKITTWFVEGLAAGMVWENQGRFFRIIGSVDVSDLGMFHVCTCQELKPKTV